MIYLAAIVLLVIIFSLTSKKDKVKNKHLSYEGTIRQDTTATGNRYLNPISVVLNDNATNYDLSVNSKVNLWAKPNSNDILVYPPVKNVGDFRPVGSFVSKKIALIYPSDLFRVSSFIIENNESSILISSNIIAINKEAEIKTHNDKFFGDLYKPAKKPLKTSVNFEMDESFQWNSRVYLSFGDIDNTIQKAAEINDWEFVLNSFWLNNESGQKISLRNCTRKGDVLKVVRNYKSGHVINLKYKKEQRGGTYGRGGNYAWDCIE
jgi:hypothetical protein